MEVRYLISVRSVPCTPYREARFLVRSGRGRSLWCIDTGDSVEQEHAAALRKWAALNQITLESIEAVTPSAPEDLRCYTAVVPEWHIEPGENYPRREAVNTRTATR
jgi:hypothetical protein